MAGSSKRTRGSGKRRRAREMAMQMLYQQELGSCPVEQVFEAFDISDYLVETEAASVSDSPESDGSTTEAPAKPAPVLSPEEEEERRRQAVESFKYAKKLVRGALEHGDSIDQRIRKHAENWRLERMPNIDRNILRLAVYEMLHEDSVPKVVIVDEAIELAKRFGSENSSRFVNGLLDGVLKAQPDAEPANTLAQQSQRP